MIKNRFRMSMEYPKCKLYLSWFILDNTGDYTTNKDCE